MEVNAWVKDLDTNKLKPVDGLQGVWARWATPSDANGRIAFGMGELRPGDVAGWHEHPEVEIFFVLEGAGEAYWRDGDREFRADLRPGSMFYKVGGVSHQIRNPGSALLRGVYFQAGGL